MCSKKTLGTLRGLRSSSGNNLNVSPRHKNFPLLKNEFDISRIVDKKITGVVPQRFNFARDIVDHWANKEATFQRNAQRPALYIVGDSYERKINYTELSQLTKQLAGVFVNDLGLSRTDRILISLPKCPEFWISIIAALRAGIEFTTVTTQSLANDFRYRIEQFQPTVVISQKISDINRALDYPQNPVKYRFCTEDSSDPNWLNINTMMYRCVMPFEGANTSVDDPALVFFTSGTTGSPKMVQHNYSYTLSQMTSDTNLLRLNSEDIVLCTADTGWAKTAFGTYPALTAGAGIAVNSSPRFDPNQLQNVLENHPITHISSAPTVYRMMLKEPNLKLSFKALRVVVSGGEPLSGQAFNEWKKRTNIEIREGYGQSETVLLCTGHPDYPAKPGSMGLPVPEYEIDVLDDDGFPIGPNEIGHFAVKIKPDHPIGLFVGYKNNAKKTADVFANDYYLTGDKVYKDTDGYFWFVSRSDDVITSSGYRIGPYEIESILLQHAAVLEAAVVGSPDNDRVEVVKAFIVLRNGHAASDKLAAEIQEFVKQQTAPYKYPRRIEFRDELPKTTSGKIQRHILRSEEKSKCAP